MRPANSMPPAAFPTACGSCKEARSTCRCRSSFERAYSHNVVMNIADKARVYREAFRVLKPGGRLVLFHVNAGPNAPVEFFPVGWASVPENSFLATNEETRRDLAAAGFDILTFRDVAVGSGQRRQRRGANWRQRACRPWVRTSSGRETVCRCRSTACAPAKMDGSARCRSLPEDQTKIPHLARKRERSAQDAR